MGVSKMLEASQSKKLSLHLDQYIDFVPLLKLFFYKLIKISIKSLMKDYKALINPNRFA